jgi:GNAT superfamily N-acetyltransferase
VISSRPATNELQDLGTGDSVEAAQAKRGKYADYRIEIQPAELRHIGQMVAIYGGYWGRIRTGRIPRALLPHGMVLVNETYEAWSARIYRSQAEPESETISRQRVRGRTWLDFDPKWAPGDGIAWGDLPGARQSELELRLRKAIVAGHAHVAVRNSEVLGFIVGSSTDPYVFELTDLFVVPSARNLGVAPALVEAGARKAQSRDYVSIIGWNASQIPGKSEVLQLYLPIADGFRFTPNLTTTLFQLRMPSPLVQPDWELWSWNNEGQFIEMHSPRVPQLRLAKHGDEERIAAASTTLFGARSVSAANVRTLFDSGPAWVASDADDNVVGYGLTSLTLPGVLEFRHLVLHPEFSSRVTAAKVLTFLHKRARAYNADVAMVPWAGPCPRYTDVFASELKATGYIPRVRMAANGRLILAARSLADEGSDKSSAPLRYVRFKEQYDSTGRPHTFDEYLALEDVGEIAGRDSQRIGFGEAQPFGPDDELDLDYRYPARRITMPTEMNRTAGPSLYGP